MIVAAASTYHVWQSPFVTNITLYDLCLGCANSVPYNVKSNCFTKFLLLTCVLYMLNHNNLFNAGLMLPDCTVT